MDFIKQLMAILRKAAPDLDLGEAEEQIKSAYEQDRSGLAEKNSELLGEVKKLKREARKAGDIDPEEYASMQERIETLESQVEEQVAANKKLAKDKDKEIGTLQERLSGEQKYLENLLVQDGLRSALAPIAKNETMLKAAMAVLSPQIVLDGEGEERGAFFTVQEEGSEEPKKVPIKDYVSSWSQSDEGKEFIKASQNSGGGFVPGGGNTTVQPEGAPKTAKDAVKAALTASDSQGG